MSTYAIIKYPPKKPNTIGKYETPFAYTEPGTDMNVIPDKVAPIIPNATKYHGELLSPVKKDLSVPFLEVKKEIEISTAKYPSTIVSARVPVISIWFIPK
jgi:hypothetical protein